LRKTIEEVAKLNEVLVDQKTMTSSKEELNKVAKVKPNFMFPAKL